MYYDPKCLSRYVAIRAVFLLWRRRAWSELAALGLGKEINDSFDAASLNLAGYRLKNDDETDAFLAMLPLDLQVNVLIAANTMTTVYREIYSKEIQADSYITRPVEKRQRRRKRR